jgi:hypothetical protein
MVVFFVKLSATSHPASAASLADDGGGNANTQTLSNEARREAGLLDFRYETSGSPERVAHTHAHRLDVDFADAHRAVTRVSQNARRGNPASREPY